MITSTSLIVPESKMRAAEVKIVWSGGVFLGGTTGERTSGAGRSGPCGQSGQPRHPETADPGVSPSTASSGSTGSRRHWFL